MILTIWHDKADKFDLVLTTPAGRRLAFPALDRTRNTLEGMVRIDLSRQRYLVNDLIQAQLAISYPAAAMLEPPRRGWKLTVTCQAASSGQLEDGRGRLGHAATLRFPPPRPSTIHSGAQRIKIKPAINSIDKTE